MKPVKMTLLLLFLSLVITSTYSQVKQFSLSNFKLPDLERKTLDVYLDLEGSNYLSKSPKNYYFSYPDSKTNNYFGTARVNYFHFINNSQYQRETFLNLNLSAKFVNSNTFKSKYFSPTIFYQRNNRKYLNFSNFYETNLHLGYSFDGVLETSNFEYKAIIHSLSLSVPIKFGTGRIEQVQDARHAMYLYDELGKIERVTANQTGEDLAEFANLIAKLKNKRFFDSRIKRMKELETIDSFLIANDHVLESDARYFTTLADYWDFGGRPVRKSGYRFSLGLFPGYHYSYYNTSGYSWIFSPAKISLNAFQFNGGVEFISEKPINLSLQNTLEFFLHGGILEGRITDYSDDDYPEIKNTVRVPNIQFGFSYSLGYYPNTRTELTLKSSFQYVNLMDKTNLANDIYSIEAHGFKPAIDLLMNYYISPQLRLNIFASFYYIWQESPDGTIIYFDQVPDGNQLIGILPTNPYSYNFYKDKELRNNFKISFVYSFL